MRAFGLCLGVGLVAACGGGPGAGADVPAPDVAADAAREAAADVPAVIDVASEAAPGPDVEAPDAPSIDAPVAIDEGPAADAPVFDAIDETISSMDAPSTLDTPRPDAPAMDASTPGPDAPSRPDEGAPADVVVPRDEPAPMATWSGPAVRVLVQRNGPSRLEVCATPTECSRSLPFFLALNTESAPIAANDWSTFDYELSLMLARFDEAATRGALSILEVHLAGTSPAFLDTLLSHLNRAGATRPYLLLRWYLAGGAGGQVLGQNLAGMTRPQPDRDDLDAPWIAAQQAEVERVLRYVDARYPGRVLGFMPKYLTGGEWFIDPLTSDGSGAGEVAPWQALNMGAFFHPNVSPAAVSEFCAWDELPAALRTGCRAPTVLERNGGTREGRIVLDPSNPDTLRAVSFARFTAVRHARAIEALARRAKEVSGGKIFTMAFYGYLLGREWYQPGSGHLALDVLANSRYVDALVGPYSYALARGVNEPMVPQGLADSPPLTQKLWINEDDTRTHLACGGADPATCAARVAFAQAYTLDESVRFLRRNVLTSALHGSGAHWLDLPLGGWFGSPGAPADSTALWGAMAGAVAQSARISAHARDRYAPQIAVFIDDASVAYTPLLNPGGESTYGYASMRYSGAVRELSRIGTPVRLYRLADLERPEFDASGVRMAVFLATSRITNAQRGAITRVLATGGRTLVYVHDAGILRGDAAPDAEGIAELVNVPVRANTGGRPSLRVRMGAGTFGPDFSLNPWFVPSSAGVTVLGTYANGGEPALVRRTTEAYSVVYSAVPGLETPQWRALAAAAGVHFFANEGDVVEASGNTLFVQAGTAGARTIALPFGPPRVFVGDASGAETLACRGCATLPARTFAAGEQVVVRWSSAPVGNVDGPGPDGMIEGWALDPDAEGRSIDVHVYVDGPFPTGRAIASVTANAPRADVNAALVVPGAHGFRFAVPAEHRGRPLFFHAIDAEDGDGNPVIGSVMP